MPQIEFVPSVRYAGAVTIFFRDKHTIIVKQGSTMLVFHRWWDRHRLDYTKSWKPFCRALREQSGLNLERCRQLAVRYEISIQSYAGGLSIPPNIKIIGGGRNGAGR